MSTPAFPRIYRLNTAGAPTNTNPPGSSGRLGDLVVDSAGALYYYNGTAWADILSAPVDGPITLQPDDNAAGAGYNITVHGGDATGLVGVGGDAELIGGDSANAAGGNIVITSGSGAIESGNITVSVPAALAGGDGGDITATAGAGNGVGAGGTITLTAGAGGITGAAGNIDINAGTGSNIFGGGEVTIDGGDAILVSGDGGGITTTAGDGFLAGAGGSIVLTAGVGGDTSGTGGNVAITAGTGGIADGLGGTASLTAGTGGLADGVGGRAVITSGNGVGAGAAGELLLQLGSATAPADEGNLRVASGAGPVDLLTLHRTDGLSLRSAADPGAGAAGALNGICGIVTLAAGGTTYTLTNTFVGVGSIVLPVFMGSTGALATTVLSAVITGGSTVVFTVNADPGGADTATIGFLVINPILV